MELIFPQNIHCISCNEPIPRSNKFSLCKRCYESIVYLYDKNTDYDREIEKILEKNYIKQVIISTLYNDITKKLIHKIKYENKTYLAKYFAQILYKTILEKNIEFDYLTYVPIHKQRHKIRGYNQVELIVKYLCRYTNKEIIRVSSRTKNTQNMYELNKTEREAEMKDAFVSVKNDKLENKTLLVVDDILTTGETILNLTKSINKSNNNTDIKVLILSRGSLK